VHIEQIAWTDIEITILAGGTFGENGVMVTGSWLLKIFGPTVAGLIFA